MDSTIIDTNKAFCSLYNKIYQTHNNFTPADHNKVKDWGYSCQCPLQIGETEHLFGRKDLWFYVECLPYAKKILYDLTEKYQVIICSIGSKENIAYKSLWLNENLNFIDDVILISNKGIKMDKSIVDMSNSTFVDDNEKNLYSSNATRKIAFGKVFDWNKAWISEGGEHAIDWIDLGMKLL